MTFLCANAETLDFGTASFDTVFLLDVVEHVSSGELETILREIRRVVKPGGALIIHTSPNVWSRTYGYWLRLLASLAMGRKPPVHPIVAHFRLLQADTEYDESKLLLHINEQSIRSLKKHLKRCGFDGRVWLYTTGNKWESRTDRKGRVLSFLYQFLGMKYLFGGDIFAVVRPHA